MNKRPSKRYKHTLKRETQNINSNNPPRRRQDGEVTSVFHQTKSVNYCLLQANLTKKKTKQKTLKQAK
ncbi:MAG TPA: hypothetical protein VIW25_10310 [Nitrososphaeraceae archaeon]